MHMYAQVLRVLEVSLQQPYAHIFREAPRFRARVPSTQTRGGQPLKWLRPPRAASLPGRRATCSAEGGVPASTLGKPRIHLRQAERTRYQCALFGAARPTALMQR